jgi:hypothetical protein
LDNDAQRLAVLLNPSTTSTQSVAVTRRLPSANDEIVATSTSPVSDGVWRAVRVSLLDGGMSVALGDPGSAPSEGLRWRDPTPVSGVFGVGLVGTLGADVSAQFRNLRVRTAATLPEGGPASATWSFSGGAALAGLRLHRAMPVPCPALPAATACSPASACQPNPGSQCLELPNQSFNDTAFATFDMPVGLDPSKGWHVKLKLALAMQLDVINNPAFLRTTIAHVNPNALTAFTGQSLFDINGGLLQPVRMFEQDTATIGTLQRAQWNLFELDVDQTAGTYVARLNGGQFPGSYPAGLGPHLGGLTLGGGGDFHAFYTGLEIAQP